jgi:YidC/Oxa1 family membrane protein insertase
MASLLSLLDPLRDRLYLLLLAYQGAIAPLAGGHSWWLAIMALTVTIRVLLLPLAVAQWRYANHRTGPLGGCLPGLLRAPVMVALFRVFAAPRVAGGPNLVLGQRFFTVSLAAQWTSLGGVGAMLASPPGLLVVALVLAIVVTAAAAQRLVPQPGGLPQPAASVARFLPAISALVAVGLPVAVLLYWLTTNLWTLGQQYLLLRL